MISVVLLILGFYYRMGSENVQVLRFTSLSGEYEVAVLGTSHATGIDFNMTDIKTVYAYKPGGTIYYDLQHYKFIKPYLADSAMIILQLSYNSFHTREIRSTEANWGDNFYHYLPARQIYDYSVAKDIRLKQHQISSNFKSWINREEIMDFDAWKAELDQRRIRQLANNCKREKFNLEVMEIGGSKRTSKSQLKNNYEHLSELITDAMDSGFQPVLVTTPYYKSYTEHFGATWLAKNYYSPMRNLTRKFDILHLDYSDVFAEEKRKFNDPSHVNVCGAVLFSELLLADLMEKEQLEFDWVDANSIRMDE